MPTTLILESHPATVASTATGTASNGAAGVQLIAAVAGLRVTLTLVNGAIASAGGDAEVVLTSVTAGGAHTDLHYAGCLAGAIGSNFIIDLPRGGISTAAGEGLGFRLLGAGAHVKVMARAIQQTGVAGI